MFGVERISTNLRIVQCFTRLIHYVQGQSPEPKVREYFYYIDHQGQLFLDDARIKNFTSCFKEKQFLQFFFSRLERNTSGRYAEHFPYLSLCGRERNFIRCDDLPIVFTELMPAVLQSQHGTAEGVTEVGSAVRLRDEQRSRGKVADEQTLLVETKNEQNLSSETRQERNLSDANQSERTRSGETKHEQPLSRETNGEKRLSCETPGDQTPSQEGQRRPRRNRPTVDPSIDRLSYCYTGEHLTHPFSPSEISMLPSTGRVYHPGPERAGGVGLVKSALALELSKLFEFRDGEGHPPTHFRWKGKTYTLTNNVLKKLEQLDRAGVS